MQAFLTEGFHHVEKDAKLAQEKNRKFEELFANLFNFATLPFYWATSEPEPGFYRFSRNENKPDIYRRPPPDVVVQAPRHNPEGALPLMAFGNLKRLAPKVGSREQARIRKIHVPLYR